MKRAFAASLLLVGMHSLPALASSSGNTLKILQLNFNSEENPNDKHEVVRDLRFKAITQWIKDMDVDIVSLQEAWTYRHDPTVALTLARALGYDLAYRLEMGFPKFFYEADAILTKKNLRMTARKNLKLPHSAPEIGNGKTWIIPFGAVSYAVGVQITLSSGEPAYVYSTHLTGSSEQDKADQALAIERDAWRRANAAGTPWEKTHIIIAGDFNSTPTDPAISDLARDGFTDAFGFAHPGDESCTDCPDPTYPWFNPFTIVSGLFPSQAGEKTSLRDDYVFVHSPTYKPLASTIVFTQPVGGVWMSDHYGNFSVLGEPGAPAVSNPAHDADENIPPTEVVSITTPQFLCADAWTDETCSTTVPPGQINGPRGVTIENNSDFYFEMEIHGPGIIFSKNTANLNPGDRVAFTFNTPGEFTYTIRNNVESPNPYRALLTGSLQVTHTGY